MGPFICGRLNPSLSNFTLAVKPREHDTDYSFCPITIKIHTQVVYDERMKIGFWSGGQRSSSTISLFS